MQDQSSDSAIIGGRYRLIKRVGIGGTSTVFEAIHLLTQEKVAIKIIPLGTMKSESRTVARFLREAKLSKEVTHRGIVKISDAWIDEHERCCLVMELLTGLSLREVIQSGRVTRLMLIKWIADCLEALEVAHRAGVIHRDLKPENLFVNLPPKAEKDTMVSSEQYYFDEEKGQILPLEEQDKTDSEDKNPILELELHPENIHVLTALIEPSSRTEVKILDFGLSRTLAEPSVTQTGHFVGTPWYMSPEQVFSPKSCTSLTDLWSCGVMLYEALCDEVPFRGVSLPSICTAISEAKIDLSSVQAVHPLASELVKVVEQCLQRDPNHRVQSAAQLKYILDAAILSFAQSDLASELVVSDLHPTPSTITRMTKAGEISEGCQTHIIEDVIVSLERGETPSQDSQYDEESESPQTLKLSSEAIKNAIKELDRMNPESQTLSVKDEPIEQIDASEISDLPTLLTKSRSPFTINDLIEAGEATASDGSEIEAAQNTLGSENIFQDTDSKASERYDPTPGGSPRERESPPLELTPPRPTIDPFQEFQTETLKKSVEVTSKRRSELWLVVLLFAFGIGVGVLIRLLG